jgi:cobalt/nickel transport system permease protein
VPGGLRHYAGFWHNAIFGGYDFTNDAHPVLGYLVSAVAGIMVIALLTLAVLAVARGRRRRASASDRVQASA